MRITGFRYHKVNIPFEAPMLWAGGINRSWTRIIVRMETDEGIEGIAETCGGEATLVQLRHLEFYEDPVWGIEGMSRVRAKVDIPLATNMCTLQRDEIPETIRLGALDVQLLDPADWGGITETWKAAATYETFQIGCGFHSGGEAGISTALQLQLAAALPVLPYAVDSHYHHQTADVITHPFEYVDGCFQLPEGPGLGVEIDEDALARCEELNEREGDLVFYGHDEAEEPRVKGIW